MKKVLVTGASGFIGRHLVQMLRARNVAVTCLVRKTSNRESLESSGCHCAFGDVSDRESLAVVVGDAQPDCVFHLAGLTKAIRRPALYDVNKDGTRHLLQTIDDLRDPPVTVVVSTLAASGPANGGPRVETDEPAPVSEYGKSKLAAEREAHRFCDRIPITVVRPPIVFGPHDKDALEMFKTIASIGIHPVPSLTGMSVSWIHVKDVCNALLAAAQNGRRMSMNSPTDGIYFATSEEVVDYAELGRKIGDAMGRRTWAVRTARPAVWALATINEVVARLKGKPNIFNFDKAREATAGSWVCSGEKLCQDTGFACQNSLVETIHSSATWYRNAGWL